jgi:hypothetical protein
MSTNNITGDRLITKPNNSSFNSNWDLIQWGKKAPKQLDADVAEAETTVGEEINTEYINDR